MGDSDLSTNYGLLADFRSHLIALVSSLMSLALGWRASVPEWLLPLLPFAVGTFVYAYFHKKQTGKEKEKSQKSESKVEEMKNQIQQKWETSEFSRKEDLEILKKEQKEKIRNLGLSSLYEERLVAFVETFAAYKNRDFEDERRHLENELAKYEEEGESETQMLLLDKFKNEYSEIIRSLDGFDDDTIKLKLRELKNKQLAEADDKFRSPMRGGESLFHSKTKNEIRIMADEAEAKLKFKPKRYFAKTANVHLEAEGMCLNPAALGSPDFVDFGIWVEDDGEPAEFFAVECFSLENSASDEDLAQSIMEQFGYYEPVIKEIIKENGHRFFLIKFENLFRDE